MNEICLLDDVQSDACSEPGLGDALDFINTLETYSRGVPVDHIESPGAAIAWLVERGAIHPEEVDGRRAALAGDREIEALLIEKVRAVRAAMRDLADATVEGRAPSEAMVVVLNDALRAHDVIQLVPRPDGVAIGHVGVGDPIERALARLVEPLVREAAGEHPDRLRVCANPSCRWVFYDSSRTGRRRWCDMATCGNRAKAARHRARVRGASAHNQPGGDHDRQVEAAGTA